MMKKQDSGKCKFVLSKEECTCPICMCIMIEPVTMPCRHSLCMPCYRQTVEKASLTCPICRLRISVWARKASKQNNLVDEAKWQAIQRAFPGKVQRRLDEKDVSEDDDENEDDYETQLRRLKELSKPGEIRQEYEAALQKLQRQREEEAKKEAEASEALIRVLQEEEELEMETWERERQETDLLGRLAAEQLDQRTNIGAREKESLSTSVPPTSHKKGNRKVKGKSKPSTSQSTSPNLTLNTFFNSVPRSSSSSAPPDPWYQGRELKQQQHSGSPYPYKCISPKEKIFYGLSHLDQPQPDSESSSDGSETLQQLDHAYSTASAQQIDLTARDADVISAPRTDIDSPIDLSHVKSEAVDIFAAGPSGLSTLVGPHFQPIASCDRTPPKKAANGVRHDPPLVRATPRNLFSSMSSLSVESIPALTTTGEVAKFSSKVSPSTRALLKGQAHKKNSPERENPPEVAQLKKCIVNLQACDPPSKSLGNGSQSQPSAVVQGPQLQTFSDCQLKSRSQTELCTSERQDQLSVSTLSAFPQDSDRSNDNAVSDSSLDSFDIHLDVTRPQGNDFKSNGSKVSKDLQAVQTRTSQCSSGEQHSVPKIKRATAVSSEAPHGVVKDILGFPSTEVLQKNVTASDVNLQKKPLEKKTGECNRDIEWRESPVSDSSDVLFLDQEDKSKSKENILQVSAPRLTDIEMIDTISDFDSHKTGPAQAGEYKSMKDVNDNCSETKSGQSSPDTERPLQTSKSENRDLSSQGRQRLVKNKKDRQVNGASEGVTLSSKSKPSLSGVVPSTNKTGNSNQLSKGTMDYFVLKSRRNSGNESADLTRSEQELGGSTKKKQKKPAKKRKRMISVSDTDDDIDDSDVESVCSKDFVSSLTADDSEKAGMTQEERDHLYALELQNMFSMLDKQNIKVDRFKGSSDEYSLRKKKRRK
ncbi:uncharacterized protein LOC101849113 [Aplysia californica]|uniref:RING-type E3 ubiquitin transferase n=1 Tax=Aplysia californica TaxID=6500 RepID=A0ABM0ZUM9_APLCA|nr:uncharacterized protein LOC101849113 [Aplysia californica]